MAEAYRLHTNAEPVLHPVLREIETVSGRMSRKIGDLAAKAGSADALAADVETLRSISSRSIQDLHCRVRELEELSVTDALTGILNRRGFDEALRRILGDARRHGESGLLVLIDLDGFKEINDIHGHEAGDTVLQAVADYLRRCIRKSDYVARLGGDEFALIFTRTNRMAMRARSLEIRKGIAALRVPFGHRSLKVGTSLGVASLGPQTSTDQAMRTADAAMYADKERRKLA